MLNRRQLIAALFGASFAAKTASAEFHMKNFAQGLVPRLVREHFGQKIPERDTEAEIDRFTDEFLEKLHAGPRLGMTDTCSKEIERLKLEALERRKRDADALDAIALLLDFAVHDTDSPSGIRKTPIRLNPETALRWIDQLRDAAERIQFNEYGPTPEEIVKLHDKATGLTEPLMYCSPDGKMLYQVGKGKV